MTNVEKLTYLTSLLEGEAESCIQGITLSNENYDIALKMLKERFGDEQIIISAHMNKLLNLETTSNFIDIKELRMLYNNIEIQIRNLRGIGLEEKRYGPMLAPVIMSKLPQEIKLLLTRKFGKDVWAIDKLLEALQQEVEAREKVLLTENEGVEKLRKPNEYRSSYRQQKKTTVPYLSMRLLWKRFTQSLSMFQDIETRKSKGFSHQTEKRCFKCLKIGHDSKSCRSMRSCYHCRKNHHSSICKTFKKEEDTPEDTQSNLASSSCTVLLQTAKAKIENVEKNRSSETVISENDRLSETVDKFWDLESLGIKCENFDNEKREFVKEFENSLKFNEKEKMYEATYPVKEENWSLGDNYELCRKRLQCLSKSFENNQQLLKDYQKIFNEQLTKGVIEKAPNDQEVGKTHCIPHHAVIKPEKSTTKVRIVYDASAKANNNELFSLNECLEAGPPLNTDLFEILLRFRTDKVAIVANETVAEAEEFVEKTKEHLSKASFNLRKFQSNSKELESKLQSKYGETENPTVMGLHGFSDASDDAHGCCIYTRIVSKDGDIKTSLVTSKSHVNPIKTKSKTKPDDQKLTTPRMELVAILIVSRLMNVVKRHLEMNFEFEKFTVWTDSSVAYCWVKNIETSRKQDRYIKNISDEIRRNFESLSIELKLVATKQNPSDIASRGSKPARLAGCKLWFYGPEFLIMPESQWPRLKVGDKFSEVPDPLTIPEKTGTNLKPFSDGVNKGPNLLNIPEEKDTLSFNISDGTEWITLPEAQSNLGEIIDVQRFRSFEQLLRVTGYVFKFVENIRCWKNKNKQQTNK
ncbi:uncharacterized protein [Clytia hemisphaerica]|uniref:uncharacterized protein n=1 Tax=Clytia hemisphaerica TaxID=252671 RepID=UPI0034D66167